MPHTDYGTFLGYVIYHYDRSVHIHLDGGHLATISRYPSGYWSATTDYGKTPLANYETALDAIRGVIAHDRKKLQEEINAAKERHTNLVLDTSNHAEGSKKRKFLICSLRDQHAKLEQLRLQQAQRETVYDTSEEDVIAV